MPTAARLHPPPSRLWKADVNHYHTNNLAHHHVNLRDGKQASMRGFASLRVLSEIVILRSLVVSKIWFLIRFVRSRSVLFPSLVNAGVFDRT